jgi:hypothetical protein
MHAEISLLKVTPFWWVLYSWCSDLVCSFYAHRSFYLKSYIFLIFGMMIDLGSAIANFAFGQ